MKHLDNRTLKTSTHSGCSRKGKQKVEANAILEQRYFTIVRLCLLGKHSIDSTTKLKQNKTKKPSSVCCCPFCFWWRARYMLRILSCNIIEVDKYLHLFFQFDRDRQQMVALSSKIGKQMDVKWLSQFAFNYMMWLEIKWGDVLSFIPDVSLHCISRAKRIMRNTRTIKSASRCYRSCTVNKSRLGRGSRKWNESQSRSDKDTRVSLSFADRRSTASAYHTGLARASVLPSWWKPKCKSLELSPLCLLFPLNEILT